MGKDYHVYSKVSKRPRRAFEKERLDKEAKICGEYGRCHPRGWLALLMLPRTCSEGRVYDVPLSAMFGHLVHLSRCINSSLCFRAPGLRNKKEIWRVGYLVSKIRSVARRLLTLPLKVSPLHSYHLSFQCLVVCHCRIRSSSSIV